MLRVWRANIHKDKTDEAKTFMNKRLSPLFMERGCISAHFAIDTTKDSPEMLIMSLWENRVALKKLIGNGKEKGFILPQASKFFKGKPKIEHFTIFSTL